MVCEMKQSCWSLRDQLVSLPSAMLVDYRITRPTIELGSLLRGVINIHSGAVASLRGNMYCTVLRELGCSDKLPRSLGAHRKVVYVYIYLAPYFVCD